MKDFFIPPKAEKSYCHQTYVTRNIKENSLDRKNMIPDGNLNLHKEIKSVPNGKNKGNF